MFQFKEVKEINKIQSSIVEKFQYHQLFIGF